MAPGIRVFTFKKSRSLRWHLFELAALSLVPAAIFSALVMFALWKTQEQQRVTSQFQTAQALGSTVTDALSSSLRRARLLGTIASNAPLADIQGIARSFLAQSSDWSNITFVSPTRQQLFNLAAPPGPLPVAADRPERRQALATNEVVMSDLFIGATRKLPVIEMAVPLSGPDYAGYLLLVSFDLRHFDRLITQTDQTQVNMASLLDRDMRIVARSLHADERRGVRVAEPNLAALAASAKDTREMTSLEGINLYVTWLRLANGWTIAYGVPTSRIETPLRRSLALLTFGWLLVLGFSLILAIRKERRMESFLQLIVRKAENIETGRELPLPESDIIELEQALKAMRHAREVLVDAVQRERVAREASEYAGRAKDEFLAMLGHELRNPIAAISNAANVIARTEAAPEQRRTASAIITRQSQHLNGIINDLLDVSRVIQGKVNLKRVPVNVAEAVLHVVGALEVAGKLARQQVECDVHETWAMADRTRLDQVIQNLLVNAVTYSDPGAPIRVSTRRTVNAAIIEVTDTGIGIDSTDLPHLFDLFFQARQDAHRPYSGLGVGLALVKRIVEMHGGSVWATSDGPGRGATFTVRLPLIERPIDAPPAEAGKSQNGTSILIVEDNQDARDSLRLALLPHWESVAAVDGGQAALDWLDANQADVALIDIGMPGMDGYETARRIRSAHGSSLILIAVSGYSGQKDRNTARAAGFDAYFTKPVDMDAMEKEIARMIADATGRL